MWSHLTACDAPVDEEDLQLLEKLFPKTGASRSGAGRGKRRDAAAGQSAADVGGSEGVNSKGKEWVIV